MMEGALSGKTGFTAKAGYCYVGALKRDERTFIVALLACGWPNNKGYKWKDTKKLMEYGLNNYEYRDVWQEFPEEEVAVKGGVSPEDDFEFDCKVRVGVKSGKEDGGIYVLLRKDEEVTTEKKLKPALNVPVKSGQNAGELVYKLNGEELRRCDIVTLEAIEERDVRWCFNKIAELFLL